MCDSSVHGKAYRATSRACLIGLCSAVNGVVCSIKLSSGLLARSVGFSAMDCSPSFYYLYCFYFVWVEVILINVINVDRGFTDLACMFNPV